MFVDSDTADPGRTFVANDTRATAQPIASQSLVGGFLGATGKDFDTSDFYVADLGNGQSATLYIGAPSDGSPLPDFDLGLYDANGKLVDSSTGTGPIEVVRTPAAGKYYLAVVAAARESGLYTLSVGTSPTGQALLDTARDRLSAMWPIVDGEALVTFRPGAPRTSSDFSRLGVRPLTTASNAIGYYRVAVDATPGTKSVCAGGVLGRDATLSAVKRLRRAPEVLHAEPNYVRQRSALPPNDPLFPVQWNYGQISLLDAWDHSTGSGAIVAVLDTGVKKAHPDFVNTDQSSQLLAGYDMISDPVEAADGDGRDANSDDPGDRALANDSSWHGTHVAGTVAAATGNALGCAGVAPLAKILPVRVLGVGGGTTDDIVQGILYSAGLQNDANVLPANRADVINLSLGSPGRSQVTADAVAAARAAGTIVVAAAGNDTTDATYYSPAGEPGVVAVGAVDLTKHVAWYSNYGSVLGVVGPGGDDSTDLNGDGVPDGVMSLIYGNGGTTLYTTYEGTSMASPHVSGIVALMRAAYPGLSPADFDHLIAGTAGTSPITEDLGPPGRDDSYGYGLLNANLAVLAALDLASMPVPQVPALILSTTTLDFGVLDDTLPLDATNAGRGALAVTSMTADQPWVSVSPGAAGNNTVTVDRTGLAPGTYSAVITVTSNGGTETVTVRVTVPSSTGIQGGDLGLVYVLLVDPKTEVVVAQTSTTGGVGYAFTLPDVPPGDYELAAGTDLDDDGYVNDDGEAFGAYRLTSDVQVVHVPADQAGLDFPMRFQYDVQIAQRGSPTSGFMRR